MCHLTSNRDSSFTQKILRVFEVLSRELGTKTKTKSSLYHRGLIMVTYQGSAEVERVTCSKPSSWSVAAMEPELTVLAYFFLNTRFVYLFVCFES